MNRLRILRLSLRLAILGILTPGVSGCTYTVEWVRQFRVERALQHQDFETALRLLQRVLQSDPDSLAALKASRQGAKIAQVEAASYPVAVEFLKTIVLRSPDDGERKAAQKSIAQIYFDNLQDYDQAVLAFERLLKLNLDSSDAFRLPSEFGKKSVAPQ